MGSYLNNTKLSSHGTEASNPPGVVQHGNTPLLSIQVSRTRLCDLSHVNSFVIISSHYMMKFIINILIYMHHLLDFSCGRK